MVVLTGTYFIYIAKIPALLSCKAATPVLVNTSSIHTDTASSLFRDTYQTEASSWRTQSNINVDTYLARVYLHTRWHGIRKPKTSTALIGPPLIIEKGKWTWRDETAFGTQRSSLVGRFQLHKHTLWDTRHSCYLSKWTKCYCSNKMILLSKCHGSQVLISRSSLHDTMLQVGVCAAFGE